MQYTQQIVPLTLLAASVSRGEEAELVEAYKLKW